MSPPVFENNNNNNDDNAVHSTLTVQATAANVSKSRAVSFVIDRGGGGAELTSSKAIQTKQQHETKHSIKDEEKEREKTPCTQQLLCGTSMLIVCDAAIRNISQEAKRRLICWSIKINRPQ